MSTKTCLCCGKTYNYCPNCGKNTSSPWMFNFDTIACKELFNAVSGYNIGTIKEDGVKEIIDKYSISDYSVYRDGIKKVLNKIKKNSSDISTNDEIVQNAENNIISNPITEEQPVEYPTEDVPRRGRRNRFYE